MATTVIDSPLSLNGAYQVASHHAGKSVVDFFQNLFPSGKKRRGDYYLDRTTSLIQQDFENYEPEDQETIHSGWKW